ncbi:MAG: cyclase family protein [Candidatus Dormibacteria bacterium]
MNRRRDVEASELGLVSTLGPSDTLAALAAVKTGRSFDLDTGWFWGMPQWSGHAPFMLTTFRTPAGLRAQADVDLLGAGNTEGFTFTSELLLTGLHVGTHIDALAHVARDGLGWFGGYTPEKNLGDFGPMRGDAATLPAMILRCTMLDAASARGVDRLPGGNRLTAAALLDIETRQGTPVPARGAAFVRTGLMGTWPQRDLFDASAGAGPDLDAARWLAEERGVFLVGSDTPTFEQVPTESSTNPHPVHDYLLRQQGIHIIENLFLEELSRARVFEFTLVCLPLRIEGATGSLLRPVAIQ